MANDNTNNRENNELKNIILTIRSYVRELFRKWYWFVVAGLLAGALAFFYHGTKETTYVSKSSLMVAGDEGGGLSGLMQLAGQFGIGKKQQVSSEKLVELLATKRIVLNTLMQPINIKDKEDLLINHYLDVFKTDEKLVEVTGVNSFRFSPKAIENFDFTENAIADKIYWKIIKNGLNASASQNGIVRVHFESISEPIAKYLNEKLVENLKTFYVDRSIEKQQETLDIITERTDSIKTVMETADRNLLNWYAGKQKRIAAQSLSPESYMRKVEYERKAEISSAAYVEAIKQKEMAEFSLETASPLIQIIDLPTFPLEKKSPSLLIYLIFALAFAFFVTAVLLVALKIIRDALAS